MCEAPALTALSCALCGRRNRRNSFHWACATPALSKLESRGRATRVTGGRFGFRAEDSTVAVRVADDSVSGARKCREPCSYEPECGFGSRAECHSEGRRDPRGVISAGNPSRGICASSFGRFAGVCKFGRGTAFRGLPWFLTRAFTPVRSEHCATTCHSLALGNESPSAILLRNRRMRWLLTPEKPHAKLAISIASPVTRLCT
jgi:hypothetical protein